MAPSEFLPNMFLGLPEMAYDVELLTVWNFSVVFLSTTMSATRWPIEEGYFIFSPRGELMSHSLHDRTAGSQSQLSFAFIWKPNIVLESLFWKEVQSAQVQKTIDRLIPQDLITML